jgi:dCTP deaminase
MILTDTEILAAFETEQIIIDPIPDFSVALSSTSLDLTLSPLVRLWRAPV